MTTMPPLTTARLTIRPFRPADLTAAHQLFDVDLAAAALGTSGPQSLAARQRWLEWAVLNEAQLAHLYQPPYGDRAVVLTATDELIGSVGYVPCLNAFSQLPDFPTAGSVPPGRQTTELGLFWAIASAHRRQGYASEAAAALIAYAFDQLQLARIVATTDHTNHASIGVMHRLGMRIARNPLPTPPWLQVVGWLSQPLDLGRHAVQCRSAHRARSS